MNISEQKAYVFDTNVLSIDPNAMRKYPGHIRVIPITVIEELNLGKGYFAPREVNRNLADISKTGWFGDGIPLEDGGLLYIFSLSKNDLNELPCGFFDNNDNNILALTKSLQGRFKEVILVTNDKSMIVKANMLRIKTEEYEHGKIVKKLDQLYSGYIEIVLPKKKLIDQIYSDKFISLSDIEGDLNLWPNQCCKFIFREHDNECSVLSIFKQKEGIFELVPRISGKKDYKNELLPDNDEQNFAYALINDPNIQMVTISGKTGSGKTLISLLSGCNLVAEGRYSKLIVFRPLIEVGSRIGTVPGDVSDKISPAFMVIQEILEFMLTRNSINLARLLGSKLKGMTNFQKVESLLKNGLIEFSPVNFQQGRTIHEAIVVIDEGQNFTRKELKMLTTRKGSDSKLIIVGDAKQRFTDGGEVSNGLVYVIERTKHRCSTGHITFNKVKRDAFVAEMEEDLN